MQEADLTVMRLTPLDIKIGLLRKGYKSVSQWAKMHGFGTDYAGRVIRRHCGTVRKGFWGQDARKILTELEKTLKRAARKQCRSDKP